MIKRKCPSAIYQTCLLTTESVSKMFVLRYTAHISAILYHSLHQWKASKGISNSLCTLFFSQPLPAVSENSATCVVTSDEWPLLTNGLLPWVQKILRTMYKKLRTMEGAAGPFWTLDTRHRCFLSADEYAIFFLFFFYWQQILQFCIVQFFCISKATNSLN